MQKFILAFVTIFHLTGFSPELQAQKPGAVIDVQHYKFAVELSDASDSIKGKSSIALQFTHDSKTILIDLISKRPDGKGMIVFDVKENNQALAYEHANDMLTIHFLSVVKRGEKRSIEIHYTGIPADGLIIANNKYKHRGFFADNWPNRARNWLPCVDHPADKAALDFIITAPAHYKVISNGVQVQEDSLDRNRKRTHYKEEIPLPTKIMVIGVSDFAVQHAGNVQNIPVYSWVYPEDKNNGFYDYAQAVDILPFFIKNVGPYPYKKLANVQSKTMFGGLENASAIFYSENSISGTRKNESLITHEIAHQWFGNMATETDWPHIWLSEGFATYMTIIYFENKYGIDTVHDMLIEDRNQVIEYTRKQQKPVVDTTITNYMQLLNANSYQKGGWILHMLRNQVGDSLFWKGVQLYYKRYAGKNASTADLQKAMEEVSGEDLSVFFRQWLFTPGHPVLNVGWQYNETTKTVIVAIAQQQSISFQFPIELLFISNDKPVKKSFIIKDKQVIFTIPLAAKPQKIITDPNIKLLFEGSIKEIL